MSEREIPRNEAFWAWSSRYIRYPWQIQNWPIMHVACLLLYLTSAIPLRQAWQANRGTSLRHALAWTSAAWIAWAAYLAILALGSPSEDMRHLTLSLTGCAGAAVLGARRPGVGAWNFVVVGLLAVLMLPWVEGVFIGGTGPRGGLPSLFLAGTLTVGIGNYLPTRLGLGALLLGVGVAAALIPSVQNQLLTGACLVLAPWVAWLPSRWRRPVPSEVDRLWLSFRDRYGVVWGQRLREQFNRSAAHANWPVQLGWWGLHAIVPLDAIREAEVRATLHALMKRFGVASGVA